MALDTKREFESLTMSQQLAEIWNDLPAKNSNLTKREFESLTIDQQLAEIWYALR